MKVLFVGQYREGTGAAKISVSLIQSLLASGMELSVRPLKLNSYQPAISPKMLELENKHQKKYDVCIQHVSPDMMVYSNKFSKNIGYFNHHTDSFRYRDWPERLNLMDEIWVPSNFVREAVLRSRVKKPIKIIPIGCREETFLSSQKDYPQIKSEKNSDFIFYTIASSFSRRKNFGALVKAFHLEFDKNEPVNLAIKFHKENSDNEISPENFVNQIKSGLKLGDTKKEILLPTQYLEDNDINSIHNSCDVFVSTSYGEGWCISAFEAMCFGKTPIVNNWSGCDYVDFSTGWRVDSHLEPVFGMEGNNSAYTGRENWAAISINHLRKCMREAYESKNSKAAAGLERMSQYTYAKIGSLIKKGLYEKES